MRYCDNRSISNAPSSLVRPLCSGIAAPPELFDISETGPASLQVPITVLTQNARVASFFVRLADLSGHTDYRRLAYWALRSFPNTHRKYEAFAAGFGHALAQL